MWWFRHGIGCFASSLNDENRRRPQTMINSSESTNGTSLAIDGADTDRFSPFGCEWSLSKCVFCVHLKTVVKAWFNSFWDKTPASSGLFLILLIKRKQKAVEWSILLKAEKRCIMSSVGVVFVTVNACIDATLTSGSILMYISILMVKWNSQIVAFHFLNVSKRLVPSSGRRMKSNHLAVSHETKDQRDYQWSVHTSIDNQK